MTKAVVRAKFICISNKALPGGDPSNVCHQIEMMPVYNDAPENASWSKYTPCGKIEMTITNATAIDKFELGKHYYVDFTPAE